MMKFNNTSAHWLHLDINSAFATIEQQANPLWRGRPVVVASYDAPYGCALAASYEAKALGIKTGTRVREARQLCPSVIVITPDPEKYRFVHAEIKKLLFCFSPIVTPKSIDEFVLDLSLSRFATKKSFRQIAVDIKNQIKIYVGEAISVSVGLAPSRFLAKTAAGMKKPDGLVEINQSNFHEAYQSLPVSDLCGIGYRTAKKISRFGINTAWDLYMLSLDDLKVIFKSANADYWYRRLRGLDAEVVAGPRKSMGHSYVMPETRLVSEALPVLAKLVDKMAFRLRKTGLAAKGISIGLAFDDHTFWGKSHKSARVLFETCEIYNFASRLALTFNGDKKVRKIAVSCFDFVPIEMIQADLFFDSSSIKNLSHAMDKIKRRWGENAIFPARMWGTEDYVPDRISFGNSTISPT